MRQPSATLAALILAATPAVSPATHPTPVGSGATSGTAFARYDYHTAEIGNEHVYRRWIMGPTYYQPIVQDLRRPERTWRPETEFRATVTGGVGVGIGAVEDASVSVVGNSVELRLRSAGLGFSIERVVRVTPGVAALRMQTIVRAGVAPVALTGYTLESLGAADLAATLARAVNFNGGADWHDAYDYRTDTHGLTFDANAEWIEVDDGSLGLLLQRRDYLSSRMRWDKGRAETGVDLSKDGLYLGPIDPFVVPNPAPAPLRARAIPAGGRLALEPVILAFGTDLDDLHWQTHRMLMSDVRPYPRTINFNTDRVRTPGIDVGARDGVNQAVFDRLAPIAEAMGVETFVLDDGWQKYNGDWTPDPDRWPNGLEYARDALEARGMRLGLWMAPGEFHPFSRAFAEHPEWTCLPTGAATAGYNALQPEEGSNAAGIGVWDFEAPGAGTRFRERMRSDIDRLARTLRLTQFKFDFLVWTDCAHGNLYAQHDAFFDEIASVSAGLGGAVGLGMDETNDFRGFPFESMLYGPTWFQNGNPPADALLHNLWTLAPHVPGFAIGQAVTIRPGLSDAEIDERMAVALGSNITFWTDIRDLEGRTAILDRVRAWTDFARSHPSLRGFAYPLLADPLGRQRWSGLQPWDRDLDRGFAMLYRFDSPEDTTVVGFRGVRDSATYRVTDERSGEWLGDFSGTTLRAGIPVTILRPKGVRILRIEPVR